jgi:hypothetical protein
MAVVSGCGTVTQPYWTDMKAHTEKLTKDNAYNTVTMVLVDKGFDIKMGNKDIGLITTEFKKFSSVGDQPPFDLFLQIKASIKEGSDKKISIILTPLEKDVNRINSAAFDEHELPSFTAEQVQNPNSLTEYGQGAIKGHLLFLNVAQGIAEPCGLGMEQLEKNIHIVEQK